MFHMEMIFDEFRSSWGEGWDGDELPFYIHLWMMFLFCVQLVSWKGQLSLLLIRFLKLAKRGTTFMNQDFTFTGTTVLTQQIPLPGAACPMSFSSASAPCLKTLKILKNCGHYFLMFHKFCWKRQQTGEVTISQESLGSVCCAITRSSHWAALAYASQKQPEKHDPLALLYILNWDLPAAHPACPWHSRGQWIPV